MMLFGIILVKLIKNVWFSITSVNWLLHCFEELTLVAVSKVSSSKNKIQWSKRMLKWDLATSLKYRVEWTHPFPGSCVRWLKRIGRFHEIRPHPSEAWPRLPRWCTDGPGQSRAWKCVATSVATCRRRSWTAWRHGAGSRRRGWPQCPSGSGILAGASSRGRMRHGVAPASTPLGSFPATAWQHSWTCRSCRSRWTGKRVLGPGASSTRLPPSSAPASAAWLTQV